MSFPSGPLTAKPACDSSSTLHGCECVFHRRDPPLGLEGQLKHITKVEADLLARNGASINEPHAYKLSSLSVSICSTQKAISGGRSRRWRQHRTKKTRRRAGRGGRGWTGGSWMCSRSRQRTHSRSSRAPSLRSARIPPWSASEISLPQSLWHNHDIDGRGERLPHSSSEGKRCCDRRDVATILHSMCLHKTTRPFTQRRTV